MTPEVLNGTFQSYDRRKLFYRFFPSAKRDHDPLIILHGHGEHTGRYEKFSRILGGENLAVAMFDSRGHGRSEGPEVYVERFED